MRCVGFFYDPRQNMPIGVIHGDPFLDNVHVDSQSGAFVGE